MSKIKLLYVGKSKYSFIEEAASLYAGRIKHYYSIETKLIAPKYKSTQAEQMKKLEATQILASIQATDYVILLDERGKSYTSLTFAKQLENWIALPSSIVFIIGGAYGFDDPIYARANKKISLSEMTFSHQLIKVVFLEQLYRACTILRGESYHNE